MIGNFSFVDLPTHFLLISTQRSQYLRAHGNSYLTNSHLTNSHIDDGRLTLLLAGDFILKMR